MSDLPTRLAEAIRTRTAIAPESPNLTVAEAYGLQDELLALLDRPVQAVKLGLTSVAKQQQMNVDEPAYGYLLEGTQVEIGTDLRRSDLIQPRVEPEIAFLIGAELGGPGVTSSHVLAATEVVMPAIDVLDSRYSGYSFTLPAVIADNISSARYALGPAVSPAGINLRLVGCMFEKNGELVDTAAGAAVLDHPAAAVAWYVRSIHRRGRTVPPGTTILAGAMTAAIPIEPGDVVRATIDRLGAVEIRCGD